MPMQSEAQRAYLHIHHPRIAEEFEEKTPKGAKLPEHVSDEKEDEEEEGHKKEAALLALTHMARLRKSAAGPAIQAPVTPYKPANLFKADSTRGGIPSAVGDITSPSRFSPAAYNHAALEQVRRSESKRIAKENPLASLLGANVPMTALAGGAAGAGIGALLAGRKRRLLGALLGGVGGAGLSYWLSSYLRNNMAKQVGASNEALTAAAKKAGPETLVTQGRPYVEAPANKSPVPDLPAASSTEPAKDLTLAPSVAVPHVAPPGAEKGRPYVEAPRDVSPGMTVPVIHPQTAQKDYTFAPNIELPGIAAPARVKPLARNETAENWNQLGGAITEVPKSYGRQLMTSVTAPVEAAARVVENPVGAVQAGANGVQRAIMFMMNPLLSATGNISPR